MKQYFKCSRRGHGKGSRYVLCSLHRWDPALWSRHPLTKKAHLAKAEDPTLGRDRLSLDCITILGAICIYGKGWNRT